MSVEQLTKANLVDTESYEILQKHDDLGIIIVQSPEGGCELWERVDWYEGESMVVDGDQYRFLRIWHGAPASG